MQKLVATLILVLGSLAAFAGPDTEADGPSQAAADIVRQSAGTDMAFLPAGMLRTVSNPADLTELLQYPADEVSIVTLKGAQVRKAMERSISLYPAPNSSFLQLSGLEVTFSKGAAPDSRVVSVTVGGSKLDDNASYTVAMPAPLARGVLGYYKVWDPSQITKADIGKTLGSLLKGKKPVESAPRWIAAP